MGAQQIPPTKPSDDEFESILSESSAESLFWDEEMERWAETILQSPDSDSSGSWEELVGSEEHSALTEAFEYFGAPDVQRDLRRPWQSPEGQGSRRAIEAASQQRSTGSGSTGPAAGRNADSSLRRPGAPTLSASQQRPSNSGSEDSRLSDLELITEARRQMRLLEVQVDSFIEMLGGLPVSVPGVRYGRLVVPPSRLAQLPRATVTVAGPVEGGMAGQQPEAAGGAAAGAGVDQGDATE